MRHPISVQPQSTYQSSNHQLRIFIVFIRCHIGAYHGPYLIFHPVTVTCNITCASLEVMCLCRVVVLWGFLGRARDKRNITLFLWIVPTQSCCPKPKRACRGRPRARVLSRGTASASVS